MTDKTEMIKELREQVADIQQILIAAEVIETKTLVKALENIIFNLSCVVAGYHHDQDNLLSE